MEPFEEFDEIYEVDEVDELDNIDGMDDESEDESESAEKLALLHEAITHHTSILLKTAEPEDLKQITEDLGIDPENITAFMEKLDAQLEEFSPPLELSQQDQDLSLEFWPPVYLVKPLFYDDLVDGRLFDIYDDEETYELFTTLTNNNFAHEVQTEGLYDYVTTMFLEEFGEKNRFPIMGQLFYMLLMSGDEKLLVRAYALEILKIHHSTLLPTLETDVEGFIGKFSRFVYRKLAKRAFVMLDARPSKEQLEQGSYTIVPSDLLYDLVSLQGDDEDEDEDEDEDYDDEDGE